MKKATFLLSVAAAMKLAAFECYNIVPCLPGEEKELAAEMAEYRRLTGWNVVMPSLSFAPGEGDPYAEAEKKLGFYRRFAAECRAVDPELRVGALIQSLLGHFVGDFPIEGRRWQRSVQADGKVYRWCMLDEGFREYVRTVVRKIAAENPCFVLTDDDVRAIGGECCCELHAAELNRRTGLKRTAEEWRKAVLAAKPGERDYGEYYKLQRESFTGLQALVRSALDEVDPAIPAGICMGGEEYRFAADHARAIAAKGQRPFFRMANSFYLEHVRGEYPMQEVITRTQALAAFYEGEDVTIIDEADTWPQNLWSKSSQGFFSHLVMAEMCGLKGAKIWFVNAHRKSGVKISREYTRILAKNRGFIDALEKALQGSKPYGVLTPIIAKPGEWNAAKANMIDEVFVRPKETWAESTLAHFGIPTAFSKDYSREGIWELKGEKTVARLDDPELKAILSHPVLLDEKAAEALGKRGFPGLKGLKEPWVYRRYTEERKTEVVGELERLGGGRFEFAVLNEQEVATLVRIAADGKSAVVAAFNPGHDPFHNFRMLLRRRPERVELLQPDGLWQQRTFDYGRDGVLLLPCDTPSQGVFVLRVTF